MCLFEMFAHDKWSLKLRFKSLEFELYIDTSGRFFNNKTKYSSRKNFHFSIQSNTQTQNSQIDYNDFLFVSLSF